MDFWVAWGLVALCIALSAFFSGSETALTAASRANMHALERGGDGRAAAVLRLLRMRARLIGAVLLCNTVANIGASALATSLLTRSFGARGVLYATAAMTVLLLIFAEVTPKTLAINYPDQMSLRVVRVVDLLVRLLGPVLVAVDAFVASLFRLFGVRIGEHTSILSGHEVLKSAVDLLHREGGVGRADRDMFGGVLDLEELTVEDAMVHRVRMRSIDADLPPQEIVRQVIASPYTRMPIWRGEPDNIVGVLHAKDLLRALDAAGGDPARISAAEIALQPWFVPNTTVLKDQLEAFLKRKTHFALVVDEYGVVMGLITLEDILEEIVGDIKDEHDVVLQGLRQNPDGSVIVDGSLPIRDLNRVMDWSLPDEGATTIAGLVIDAAQTIPEAGQVFSFFGFRFEVLRKQRNRVASVRITPAAKATEG
jgi:Mg2+/Co2+ transporter CorB